MNIKKAKQKSRKKHIAEWSKFLKEDYDFDWAYILRTLIFKIKRTRDCFIKNGVLHHKQLKQIEKQMTECATLLQNVIDDNYYDKYAKELDKKYGKLIHKHKKLENGHTELILYREKETPENKKEVRRFERQSFSKAYKDQQKDLNKALAIISKYLFWWWD